MPTAFTVMTWNVENLFPPGHAISPSKVISPADYESKLSYLKQRILEVDPDVIALQEIGSRSPDDTQSLDDLQAHLQNYPYKALSSNPDRRLIRVGFLSKLDILQTDDFADFPAGELSQVPDWSSKPPVTQMGRGGLRIEIELSSGLRIRLINLHLKSKLITYLPTARANPRFQPRDENERSIGQGLALLRRTAEAVTVRVYLNSLMQPDDTTETIVLGDLNDEPRAATTQLLLGPEDADITTDDKLDIVRLYNLVDSIPRRGDESNDKRFLSSKERFSRIYKGRYELIDHILVSKGLLGTESSLRQDQWRVLEVRSLVDSIQQQSIGDNPAERFGKNRPDHAPIYARFTL